MNAIRFETKSYNGIIRIPPEYMEFSDRELEVVVLMKEDIGKCREHFLASVKKHRFRLPSDYRFDREEVHER
jgi:hypothetical protein